MCVISQFELQISMPGGVLRFTGGEQQWENHDNLFDWTDQLPQDNDDDSSNQEEAVYETLTTDVGDEDDTVVEATVKPPKLPPRNTTGYRSAEFPVAYESPKFMQTRQESSMKDKPGITRRVSESFQFSVLFATFQMIPSGEL